MTNIAEPTPEMIEAASEAIHDFLDERFPDGAMPGGQQLFADDHLDAEFKHEAGCDELAKVMLEAALRSAPQEPDDALIRKLAAEIMAAMRRAKFPTEYAAEAHDEFEALTLVPMLKGLPPVAQEPVADDDAEWALSMAKAFHEERLPREFWPDIAERMKRIANRLQAPETGEE